MPSAAAGLPAPSPGGSAPTTGSAEGASVAPREKKRRRRTRPHEANMLMSAYMQNPFPNEKTRTRLASALGMTSRAVSIWFQNRRQADKKRSQRYHGPVSTGALVRAPQAPVFMPPDSLHERDLQRVLGGASAALPTRSVLRRAVSLPSVSLETTSGGRAELGGAGAPENDREIWRRMESSSCAGSSDSEDLPLAEDEDDEERTLRVLARRRLARVQSQPNRDSADARDAIRCAGRGGLKRTASDGGAAFRRTHERGALRRVPSDCDGSFRRVPSVSLEWAATHQDLEDKENVPPVPARPTGFRRWASDARVHARHPCRPAIGSTQPSVHHTDRPNGPRVSRPLVSLPTHYASKLAPLTAQRESCAREAHGAARRPLRRVVSGPAVAAAPEKVEQVADDSGYFEDTSGDSSTQLTRSDGTASPVDIPERDRQAAELLLGLGLGGA